MKLRKLLAVSGALLAVGLLPFVTEAGRPNPPGIRGTVAMLQTAPPRVHVLDEHGRDVADLEATPNGANADFEVILKKAGTYAVWAYQPSNGTNIISKASLVDVPRKQISFVSLAWQ